MRREEDKYEYGGAGDNEEVDGVGDVVDGGGCVMREYKGSRRPECDGGVVASPQLLHTDAHAGGHGCGSRDQRSLFAHPAVPRQCHPGPRGGAECQQQPAAAGRCPTIPCAAAVLGHDGAQEHEQRLRSGNHALPDHGPRAGH